MHTVGVIRAYGGMLLAKRYAYTCTAHSPTHERGVWSSREAIDGSGIWEEVGKLGAGIKLHGFKQASTTLQALPALLMHMEQQRDQSLVLGALKPESVIQIDGDWRDTIGRTIANYDDVPSRLLPLDLDNLPGDLFDARDIVRDTLDSVAELEGCAHVGAFTGSAGVKAGIRARAFVELAEPMTTRQMKRFVERVNAASGKKLFDASLYSPGHIIATAAPMLFARYAFGPQTRQIDIRRPVPPPTAWFQPGDTAEIDLDQLADSAGIPATQLEAIERLANSDIRSGDVAQWLEQLAPGNCADNIHRLICSAAFRAPETRQEESLAELYASVRRRVLAISTDGKFRDRERDHLNINRWREVWALARQRKGKIAVTTLPAAAAPARTSLLSPREQLVAEVARAADEIIDGKRALQVIVTAPPGAGKSFALKEVVTEARLANRRIRLFAPTHELCAQLTNDLQDHARTLPLTSTFTHEALSARIRHHKGRKQKGMCVNERFGLLAERAESVGMSPKKFVCGACPDRGTCKWLAQDKDDGPGVIVEPHQAITGKARETDDWADLHIIDESMLGVMLGGDAEPLAIDALIPKKAAAGYADLARTRQELVATLERHVPKAPTERGVLPADPAMTSPATYIVAGQEHHGLYVDRLMAIEERHRQTLARTVMASAQWHDAAAAFAVSLRVTALYEAMKLSAGKEYTFGARVWWRRARQGARWGTVKLFAVQHRRSLPPHVLARGAIWLDGTARLDGTLDTWRTMLRPTGGAIDEREIVVQPAMGSVKAVQCVDSSYAKSALLETSTSEHPDQEALEASAELLSSPVLNALDPQDAAALRANASAAVVAITHNQRRRTNRVTERLRNVWLLLLGKSAAYPKVLLIAQQDVIKALRDKGLPGNVHTAHFNALRGLNRYKDVPCAVVVGRPAADQHALEMLTEALHIEKPLTRINRTQVWGRGSGKLLLTGNRVADITTEQHADPLVSQLQSLISHAEVVQAVARIRPFDRTPQNPCDLTICGQYGTMIPVDRAASLDEIRPDPLDVMLSQAGVPHSQADREKLYPQLHVTQDAVDRLMLQPPAGTEVAIYNRLNEPAAGCMALVRVGGRQTLRDALSDAYATRVAAGTPDAATRNAKRRGVALGAYQRTAVGLDGLLDVSDGPVEFGEFMSRWAGWSM